jgi:NDP-sugar pyrophosphorylase family protein
MTLAHVSDANRFGQVEFAEHGRLTRFAEKCESQGAGWINAGVYVLNRALVQDIPVGHAVSLEREMLPTWVHHHRVFGFQTTGRFLDIGTPSSYSEAATFFPSDCASRGSERIHYAVS